MNRLKAFKLRNSYENNSNTLNQLVKLAVNGDFFAQYYLADIFFFGENIEKNLSKGIELYRISFENGCGDSAMRLGDLYNTNFISINEKELDFYKNDSYANKFYSSGFKFLKKQFEQGDHLAADLISGCFFSGHGVTYDLEMGRKWMKIYEQNSEWYLT